MKKIINLLIFLFFSASVCEAAKTKFKPHPIGFSIPEQKIVSVIPKKDQDFAFLIPGDSSTYIYDNEIDYYKDYQRSYFALTWKKAGWDCLRHYEILANGCIPYFVDLDQCDENTMTFLPKELIKEAMNLEGVSYGHIDHSKFDQVKYNTILKKLLAHTRRYLTTKEMASYLLKRVGYTGKGKILFLSSSPHVDYQRCLTLIGLKELFPNKVVDSIKVEHIYKNYPHDVRHLYGKGITYTKIIDDLPVNRKNIKHRIRNKEFNLIIYGSYHRGLPYHDLVVSTYEPEKIVYICGEDDHCCESAHLQNFFLREFYTQKP